MLKTKRLPCCTQWEIRIAIEIALLPFRWETLSPTYFPLDAQPEYVATPCQDWCDRRYESAQQAVYGTTMFEEAKIPVSITIADFIRMTRQRSVQLTMKFLPENN